jgi:integrase
MIRQGFDNSQINQFSDITYPKTIESFKDMFLRTAKNSAKALNTYGWIFEQFPVDKPINDRLLKSIVDQTKPYSIKRHKACSILQLLLNFLGEKTSIDLQLLGRMINNSSQEEIARANARLKADCVGVSILARGKRLYCRATCPNRHNPDSVNWHQQDIPLGSYANIAGIQTAELEARKIGALLASKQFNWTPYLRRHQKQLLIGEIIQELKKDYFRKNEDTKTSQNSWKSNLWDHLKKLPQDQPLSKKILLQAIDDTDPETSNRHKLCSALKRLVKFVQFEVDIDFTELGKNYSPKGRNLPDDEVIIEWYDKIPDPFWRAIYALIAVYGFRPHEVFHIDLTDLRNGEDFIRVGPKTKTGARLAFPLYTEWVEELEIRKIQLPKFDTEGESNAILGAKIAVAFKRFGIPFAPYDLRHSWARRSIDCEMDPRKAAESLGHNLNTHYKKYNKHFKETDALRAYNNLKGKQQGRIIPRRFRSDVQ